MDVEYSFDGRASRGEYAWAMVLLVALFWPVYLIVVLVVSIVPPLAIAAIIGIPTLFGLLAMMATVRRLQDLGASGLHVLAPVGFVAVALVFQHEPVALACSILLMFWGIAVLVLPSQQGPNRYGPQPGVKG